MGHHTVVAGLGHGGRCAAQRGNQHADAVAACRRGCGLQRKRPANTCFTCDFCFPTHNCNSVAASRPSRCACHGGSEHFAFFLCGRRLRRLAAGAACRGGACAALGWLAGRRMHAHGVFSLQRRPLATRTTTACQMASMSGRTKTRSWRRALLPGFVQTHHRIDHTSGFHVRLG